MKSILDPSFRYTKSIDTDLRKTFARVLRDRRMEARRNASAVGEVMTVVPMRRRAPTQH